LTIKRRNTLYPNPLLAIYDCFGTDPARQATIKDSASGNLAFRNNSNATKAKLI
jgi:hypothetical protein